uniref:Alpha-type protein kinase domain-containing protein n=1 Tax=Mucochytrium quahogii TaxID=96639 RepID=A0A7S2RAN3_9STRA|mmetsp:Transcript_22927/g.36533  ORF Transcript_22927/g.36533 Transcript_22927/m.36533 type:complete len:632 (+) Transcript_22927:190-2085(+)|eukprot:CAMPEP_0203754184 /NCGR_PEP_ID=MMETSP0098-20131031/7821_1 /ASSEMBLY_ACC=CAM_ASM_000208 /TAXON_ID=96639 /ORGANISM=" , Strain NY0313808BC1" /LENGTH=631 /DNA_ID=CAMNT_0050645079 /DNA_START=146 /DNA_END=2041 /DNA_ORIENTATION=-
MFGTVERTTENGFRSLSKGSHVKSSVKNGQFDYWKREHDLEKFYHIHASKVSKGASQGQGRDIKAKKSVSVPKRKVSERWKKLAKECFKRSDPFEDLTTPDVETIQALEHVYDPKTSKWYRRPCLCRIQFGHEYGKGAMRVCYAMKMVSSAGVNNTFKQMSDDYRYLTGETVLFKGETGGCFRESLGLPSDGTPVSTLEALKRLSLTDSSDVMGKASECLEEENMLEFHSELMKGTAVSQRFQAAWAHSSINYMAKTYSKSLSDQEMLALFKRDTKMQEVCKLLAQMYNTHDPLPPKPVDMLHCGILELQGVPDQKFIEFESFVEGDFHKWNTNAGWIDEQTIRHTPQAFSFFTFRYTEGTLVVVDVQGINDLYTDPQICTIDGRDFGRGNVGLQGMARFLNAFRYDCNPIVQYMGLAPFLLCPGEQSPPTEAELERFRKGMEYLQSSVWKSRAAATSIENLDSQGSAESPNAIVNDGLETLEPPSTGENIPRKVTAEALVHRELAGLHRDEDPMVLSHRVCSAEQAIDFHLWLAALGGCRKSMRDCAKRCEALSNDMWARKWWILCSSVGSREASIRVAENYVYTGKTRFAKIYYKKALTQHEGRSEAERVAFGLLTDADIQKRLEALTC